MFFRKVVIFSFLLFFFCSLFSAQQVLLPKELTQEKKVSKLILVIIHEQFLGGYEYGKLEFSYPISSGIEKGLTPSGYLEEGKESPTIRGRFKIFYKSTYHVSSIYGLPMPWMLAFTTDGHAIHAGKLLGYPGSHGCVRLLKKDAKNLFTWADIGTIVLVVDSFKDLEF